MPEEEIFGTVLRDKSRITSSCFTVKLTVQNNDGCIFGLDSLGHSKACQTTAIMPIMTRGSRVGFADHMWGWFNNLDTDNNPCNTALIFARRERHDLDNDGVRDQNGPEKGPEQHCFKPGKYKVELINGSVQRSRIVEHRRTKGLVVTPDNSSGKDIENASGSQATDTFVHFDIGSAAYSITSGTNVVQIDNPNTSGLFVEADTLTDPNVRMRFNSPVTTPRVQDVPAQGPLMNRIYFDLVQAPLLRTEYWNPDRIVRTRLYPSDEIRSFTVRSEFVTPIQANDTGTFSPVKRVVIPAVATVSVSPSSATITSQNGTKSLTATLKDSGGNIRINRTVTWSSSNTTVATVSGNGSSATVTGKTNGTATITAASEGKSGTSIITVILGADNASPNGNTFPAAITAGGITSVTLSMKNSGTTTWTSTAGYQLKLFRDAAFWLPLTRTLSGSVAAGGTTTFGFDLRHIEPGVTGTIPVFYRMAKSNVFFGTENGRDITVTAPKGGTALVSLDATAPQALSSEAVADWVSGAEDAGTSELPIAVDALLKDGAVVLEYSYDHDMPRNLAIVLRFTFDRQVLEALPIESAEGAVNLVIEEGLVTPGEYWVRLTGTVPAGQGLIAGLPFRLVPGAKPPRNLSLGTLTVYYP